MTASRRAFADLSGLKVDPAHARFCGELDEIRVELSELAATDAEFLFGQYDDGATFGGFVREGGKLSGVGQILFRHALDGEEFAGLSVAQRDGAGLVQEQHVHVARRLNGAATHRQHVRLIEPAHPGDADGGEQRADGGRREADQKGNDVRDRYRAARAGLSPGEVGEGQKRRAHHQKDDGQCNEQDLQRDFVGGLFPGSAFDHRDHFVKEALARLRRHTDDQPVR